MEFKKRGRPRVQNRDPMNQIKIWRQELRENKKIYSAGKKMALRNKITALISREKNREKVEFLQTLISDKDQLMSDGINILSSTISSHCQNQEIFKELNEGLSNIFATDH